MNEQLLFDTALKHIREQGKPSLGKDGYCAYRGEKGLQCAFGPFIEHYHPTMEGIDASGVLRKHNSSIKKEFRNVDKNLANCVQTAHDSAHTGKYFMQDFEAEMQIVASLWDLNYA